jgi:hypothetical protein
MAFSKKWLLFHTNNYFITQILPENIKILTWILHDFCLSFTVWGILHPPRPGRYVPARMPETLVECLHDSNGTAVVIKFTNILGLEQYLYSLSIELHANSFSEIVSV